MYAEAVSDSGSETEGGRCWSASPAVPAAPAGQGTGRGGKGRYEQHLLGGEEGYSGPREQCLLGGEGRCRRKDVRQSANSHPETSGEEPTPGGRRGNVPLAASRRKPRGGTPVRGNYQRRNLAHWETQETLHPGRGGDTVADPTRGTYLPIHWELCPCRAHGVVLANSIVPG